jgi:hypothetical protein
VPSLPAVGRAFGLVVGVVAALATSFAGLRDASAHPGITGYSGKPYNGVSETCTTNCHAAGANPPTVTITAPATVPAGSTSLVTVVVAGNRMRTSMNAAFTDGTKTTKGSNTDTPLPSQEPTEIATVVPPPGGKSATYKFSFIAPNVAGPIKLYVSGMAANGSGAGGDAVTSTSQTITVTAADGGSPADAGTDSGSAGNAGASSGGTSGTSGTSGTGGAQPTDAGTGDPGSSSGSASSSGVADTSGGSDTGGCSVSPVASGHRAGSPFGLVSFDRCSFDFSSLGRFGLTALALAAVVGRRRRVRA